MASGALTSGVKIEVYDQRNRNKRCEDYSCNKDSHARYHGELLYEREKCFLNENVEQVPYTDECYPENGHISIFHVYCFLLVTDIFSQATKL